MDIKLIEKDVLACIDLSKLSGVIVDEVIFASLKKIVDDSSNKFDDAAYAMLAPLLEVEAKKALAELAVKLQS